MATAAALYTECDGIEFEHSACKMDLRFIPDEQRFEGRQVGGWAVGRSLVGGWFGACEWTSGSLRDVPH